MGEEKNLSETDLISRESGAQFESLPEMKLTTRLILGECQMEISEILKLGQGSVLELDSMTGQPLELWVNDQFIAKVHPVISNDKVGAQIQEIASKEQRMREITIQKDE